MPAEYPIQTGSLLPYLDPNLPKTKLLEKITQLVPGLIAVYNIHSGKYIFVNDSVTPILGYSKGAFLKGGLPFIASLVHPDDFKSLMEKNNAALKKANSNPFRTKNLNELVTFEYRMKHKNGSWRWLHTTGIVFERNLKGEVENILNISIDISQRKETEILEKRKRQEIEENLRKSEERFQALLEQSADAITLLDRTGRRIYASPSRKNILGYDSKKDYGRSVFDLVHPDDKVQVQSSFQDLISKPGKSITMVFRARHQKGQWLWVEATGTNLFHIPQVGAIVVNYHDVSEKKETEEKKQFLEKATNILISSIDFETTLKNIVNLIVPTLADYCRIAILDEEGQVREVSLNHIDQQKVTLVKKLYLQYKDAPNATHGINKILETGEPEMISKLTPTILKPFQNQTNLLKTLEQLQIKSYMGVPLKSRGKIIGAMTFSSTRDDVIYNQESLTFVQELAYRVALVLDNARLYTNEQNAVKLRDQFISTASHELKTPITSMKGFVQIAQKYATLPKVKYFLSKLDDQMTRLVDLINNLLDVSKIQQGKLNLNKEPFFLNSFLQEIIDDIQTMDEGHSLILLTSKDIKIQADKYRLSQVIINLLTNAIKYSPRSPRILISTSSFAKVVKIKVQDFGIGIAPKNLKKIFDPFYQADTRVRQSFGGLGLGLHISQEIVKRHDGEILVDSQKGKGSTFTVVLPLG